MFDSKVFMIKINCVRIDIDSEVLLNSLALKPRGPTRGIELFLDWYESKWIYCSRAFTTYSISINPNKTLLYSLVYINQMLLALCILFYLSYKIQLKSISFAKRGYITLTLESKQSIIPTNVILSSMVQVKLMNISTRFL